MKKAPLSTRWPKSGSDEPEAAVAPAADLPPKGLREQLAHLRERVEPLPQPHGADLAGARRAFGGAGQDPLAPAERGLVQVGPDVLRRDVMMDADDGSPEPVVPGFHRVHVHLAADELLGRMVHRLV